MLKRPLNDERGIGLIIEIVIGAIVLVVIGLAGLQYYKAKSGGTSLIPAKVTLNSKCALNDADLCKFTNNWKGNTSYTIKASQVHKDGKKSDSTFEIAGEDKFHLSSTTDGKAVMEMIGIGKTTYMLDYTDQKWWEQTSEKTTGDTVKSAFEFKADEETTPAAEKTQYKALGKEACGSLKCFKYEVIEPLGAEKQYIWFDDYNYLLRRMQTVSDTDTVEMTFTYNKPTITAPTPTKQAPTGQMQIPMDNFDQSQE